MNLVLEAHTILKDNFPKAAAATNHLGGVRLTWKNPKLELTVRLTSPAAPNQVADLDHSTPNEYAVEDVTSAAALIHWLEWLIQA
jgi:hypothetical protein